MFWKKSKNKVNWGTLRSFKPVSSNWGFDRGVPVDRYYIDKFLRGNEQHIRGNCLELLNNIYTKSFGKQVTSSDILDINKENKDANIIGDLSLSGGSPLKSSHYDCIILTQVLQHIFDVNTALKNCYDALKPGGYLLVTVPFVMKYHEEPHDCWRFTPYSLERLAKDAGFASAEISSYGNLITSICFLQGMSKSDITQQELDHYDKNFLVSVCCAARK